MAKLRKGKFVDKTVLEMAYERINRAFDLFDHIAVSFSGGKDSTVCLNLTLEVARQRGRLPLRVFFHDEEAIPYQTEEYVRRVNLREDVSLEWYCLPVKHRNACSRRSPWWSPWDPNDQEKWVRPLPPEAITVLSGFGGTRPEERYSIPDTNGLLTDPAIHGTTGFIMGVRAQESLLRRAAVSHRQEENYLIKYEGATSRGNLWKVYPVYDWLTDDVWTAPNLLDWDYNRAYDVMEQCGIPHSQQRCCPAYGEEPMQGFFRFKSCFPEIWDKMSVRVPGANTALFYARTELFGSSTVVEKPDDMTWEDYLLHYIVKFAPDDVPTVAKRVQRCIREHYGKTADPIIYSMPHPVTGASWKDILAIAMRGDFKDRRPAALKKKSAQYQGRDMEHAWKEYHTARQAEGL
jgi:predicted phosphoadenosine phosphosulfate sulfurtransferase